MPGLLGALGEAVAKDVDVLVVALQEAINGNQVRLQALLVRAASAGTGGTREPLDTGR